MLYLSQARSGKNQKILLSWYGAKLNNSYAVLARYDAPLVPPELLSGT